MASHTSANSFGSRYPPRPPGPPTEDVDPIWLVKGLVVALGAAAVLGYLSVCLLVLQGGWQRMLAPVQVVRQTPSMPFQAIAFDSATTGRPRLTGWWIPVAEPDAPTILFLHDGTGSLADTVDRLTLLHQRSVNLFAFDYRGFGSSESIHPNQLRMAEDAEAALSYLVGTRHVPAGSIVPYGQGLGAVLAAEIVNRHTELPAVMLDTPDPGAFRRVVDDPRSRLLPMRLLIRDRFDVAAAIAACNKPKLMLADDRLGSGVSRVRANQSLFRNAPDPKLTVTLAGPHFETLYGETVSRFLDQYVPRRGNR